jgi:hypothetical protein
MCVYLVLKNIKRFANNIRGGEGGNRPWVLRILIYVGVMLERGEDWFEPALNIVTPLSPTHHNFFYLSLLNSVAKRKLFLGKK